MKTVSKLHHALLVLACLLLAMTLSTGCTQKQATPSGTLSDYTRLAEDPMDKGAMVWLDPDADLKKYTKFILEPVTLHIPPETLAEMSDIFKNEKGEFSGEIVNRGSAYFEEKIKASLAPEFEVVEQAGPGVARIKPVITGVAVDKQSLKAYQFIPVALVLTGAAEATGNRDKVVLASMEGQVFDSVTGQLLGEVLQQSGTQMDVKNIKTPEDVLKLDMYPNLDHWAEKFKERLLNIHK